MFSHSISNCIMSKSFVILLQVHSQSALRIVVYKPFPPEDIPHRDLPAQTGCVFRKMRLVRRHRKVCRVIFLWILLNSTTLLEFLATCWDQFAYRCAMLMPRDNAWSMSIRRWVGYWSSPNPHRCMWVDERSEDRDWMRQFSTWWPCDFVYTYQGTSQRMPT